VAGSCLTANLAETLLTFSLQLFDTAGMWVGRNFFIEGQQHNVIGVLFTMTYAVNHCMQSSKGEPTTSVLFHWICENHMEVTLVMTGGGV